MYLKILLKHQKGVLIVWAMLLLVSLFFISNKLFVSGKSVIDNSVGIWFDQKDTALQNYQAYNKTFGEEEWSLLLLETDSVYSTDFLRDLRSITDKISSLEHVLKVTSIANVRDNFNSDDGMLDYQALYSDEVLQNSVALNNFRKQLERNPIFDKNLILRSDDRYTMVLIQNSNYIFEQSAYRIELVDAVSEILNSYPSIRDYALAGTTVVNAELNRAAKRDVFVFYLLVTVLLTLVAYLMLRSLRDVLVMFAVVVTSVLPTMGLLAAMGIAYNMVTVMLPTILIALSVAGVIHIITEFHRECGSVNNESAMRRTLTRLYKPTIWTTVTTVVGFSSFATSEVFPIFQLGAFAALGLTLACAANLTIAPILLLRFRSRLSTVNAHHSNTIFLKFLTLQKIKGISFVWLLILMPPLLGLPTLQVDTNYLKFFSSSHDTSRAYESIREAGFAQNPIIIHLRYEQDARYSDADSLNATLAFESVVKRQPEVIKLLTPSDLLQEINLAFNETEAKPLSDYDVSQVEQLILLGELSGNDDLTDLLETSGEDIQLVVMTQYMSSDELQAFKSKLIEIKQANLPADIKINITGTTTLWANMDTQVSKTQFLSLTIITLFLVIFLPLIFRSIKLGLIGLAINVIPLAVTLGCMSLLDIKINMATALIGGISLGVVVDDTIHFITRVVQNRQLNLSNTDAVDEAIKSVGKSIVQTTLILVLGFSCMATSEFLPTAHFGIFISLSILLALILDLICLPTVLKMFPKITSHNSGEKWAIERMV